MVDKPIKMLWARNLLKQPLGQDGVDAPVAVDPSLVPVNRRHSYRTPKGSADSDESSRG